MISELPELPGGLFTPEEVDPDWEPDLPHEGALIDDLFGLNSGVSPLSDEPSFIGSFQEAWETGQSPATTGGMDTLAYYRAWHWFGNKEWGVVVCARPFILASVALTAALRKRPGRALHLVEVARDLYGMLVVHETFHLEVELAASHLETQLARSLYREHALSRFELPNPWTVGPLEELLATWHELAAVVRHKRVAAVWGSFTRSAPSGYCDFRKAKDPRTRELMFDQLAGDLAATPWGWPSDLLEQDERAEVRVRINDGRFGFFFDHFLPKERAPTLTHKQFDRWFAKNVVPLGGGITEHGGGPHPKKVHVPGQRTCGLSTSKRDGARIIPPNELRSLSQTLAFDNASALRRAVRENLPPEGLLRLLSPA